MSTASSAQTNVAGHELIFLTLHIAERGSTAASHHQLCGLSSFSGEVIVVNRHVLHIQFCAGIFNEGRTLHATPVMCIAGVIQMAGSSRGLFHTRFTTACSLLDSELCMSDVCVVACVFKGYTHTIILASA